MGRISVPPSSPPSGLIRLPHSRHSVPNEHFANDIVFISGQFPALIPFHSTMQVDTRSQDKFRGGGLRRGQETLFVTGGIRHGRCQVSKPIATSVSYEASMSRTELFVPQGFPSERPSMADGSVIFEIETDLGTVSDLPVQASTDYLESTNGKEFRVQFGNVPFKSDGGHSGGTGTRRSEL